MTGSRRTTPNGGQRYLVQVREPHGSGVEVMRLASVPATASKIAALLTRQWPEHQVEVVDLWAARTVRD